MDDPVEKIVANALNARGIRFVNGDDPRSVGLDFYLPDLRLHIEVKQFHTYRTAEQMSRVQDVIVIQGKHAARMFAEMIGD